MESRIVFHPTRRRSSLCCPLWCLFFIGSILAAAPPVPVPVIASGGIVEPWTYTAGIAPGAWVSIYGSSLASTAQSWSPTPNQTIATTLGGVSVAVNGILAPLSYVSPTLVNILVPGNVAAGSVTVVVTNQGVNSAPYIIPCSPYLAAIYGNVAPNVSPARFYVTAVDPLSGNLLGNRTTDPRVVRGVLPGDTIDLYAIGLGAPQGTTPPTSTDFTSPYPLSTNFTIWLGSSPIAPIYAALISPGLYQVRITVPVNTSGGDLPIYLDFGAASSAGNVYLTVQTVTATVQVVSGNLQTATVNSSFAAPLVVQVLAAGTPAPNTPVQFVGSGPVTLSASQVLTDANGLAEVTMAAGSVAGAASVTALALGASATIYLTVLPAGPAITAQSFANAASGQTGGLSPCGLATITGDGLAPNGTASLFPGWVIGRPPKSVGGTAVNFNGYLAPILRVSMADTQPQLLVQVPCELSPSASTPVTVTAGGGSTTLNVPVLAASPGILQGPYSDGVVRAIAVRSDGTFVDVLNPARAGEVVLVYVTGLGPTVPQVGTAALSNPFASQAGVFSQPAGTAIVELTQSGLRAIVQGAKLSPNLIGVFEIAFTMPANVTSGSNVPITVGYIPAGSSTRVDALSSILPVLGASSPGSGAAARAR